MSEERREKLGLATAAVIARMHIAVAPPGARDRITAGIAGVGRALNENEVKSDEALLVLEMALLAVAYASDIDPVILGTALIEHHLRMQSNACPHTPAGTHDHYRVPDNGAPGGQR